MAEEDLEEEVDAEEEGEEGKKKKLSGRTLVLFIIAPILLIAVLGGGAFMFLGGGEEDAELAEGAENAAPLHDPREVVFVAMPPILANLQGSNGKTPFLKLNVDLEVGKDQDLAVLEAAMPRVRDRFQVYLRELRVEDLSGSAGMHRVKEELLRRVNLAADPVLVDAVLIREMIVQ